MTMTGFTVFVITTLTLFVITTLTLFVGWVCVHGITVWSRTREWRLLPVLAVIALPLVSVWWVVRPWEGVTPPGAILAVGAACVCTYLLTRVSAPRHQKVPVEGRDEEGVVTLIRLGQPREGEGESWYVKVTAAGLPAPRLGWVPTVGDTGTVRLDGVLTRMGWHRTTPWQATRSGTPGSGTHLSCRAIPEGLTLDAVTPHTAPGGRGGPTAE